MSGLTTRSAGGDLYVARRERVTDAFDTPAPISELNTSALDQDPWISPDGRHLYFASDRDGGLAIYESTR
ncbi:WD40-like Beta Propeller Repeat protein [compost metagenome]